jgi:hypothetical protein
MRLTLTSNATILEETTAPPDGHVAGEFVDERQTRGIGEDTSPAQDDRWAASPRKVCLATV